MDISRKCKFNWLSVSLKQKIFDQFQQKWRSDIENSPKGLSYRLFKENFEFEYYLDILPDKDRITYCRFRTGNHRLPIETGRWHRIERQNRHCNLCQYQELRDEFHYILQCRSLVDIRKQFLNPYFIHRINILKFGKLFQSKQKSKFSLQIYKGYKFSSCSSRLILCCCCTVFVNHFTYFILSCVLLLFMLSY